jgi:hypothetical protein
VRRKNRSKRIHLHVEQLEARDLLNGQWTALANPAPDVTGTMMLLTDGTVMVQDNSFTSNTPYNQWFRLTPDSTGSYVNGTWSSLASMSTQRLYFASTVLPSGNVFLVGGEYSDPNLDINWTNTGEMFNPVANTWTPIATFPQANFGDDPSMLLPNGQILTGYLAGPQTYIYDPASNTWSFAANKLRGDASDEEAWVKLPDNSILSYDIFSSIATGVSTAQRYIPSENQWVDAGVVPVQLSSPAVGYEMGPSMLLPNGKVFVIGANGNTALYTPATNSWAAGPQIIGTLNGQLALFGADDAPATVLPNGHVLFTADAGPTSGVFSPPAGLFEYNPFANTIREVSTPDQNLANWSCYLDRMLVLPNGQVLFSDGVSNQLWVYTPDGTAPPQWQPRIQNVGYNGNGVFALLGTQLNGLSAGAAYGDDVEMDSNYPIVYLKSANQVICARTFDWSNTGVATRNTPETVNFVLPPGVAAGRYQLYVSGAGISSQPFAFTVTPAEATTGSGDGGTTAAFEGGRLAPRSAPAVPAVEISDATRLAIATPSELAIGTLNRAQFEVPLGGQPTAHGTASVVNLTSSQTSPPAVQQAPLLSLYGSAADYNDEKALDTQTVDAVFAKLLDSGL